MNRRIACLAACVGVLLVPVAARAQSATTGAIAGVARDITGAVLPGVTVEAASPALIEKVRTAVTDEQGNYKITDLRPGAYSVTFTLAGFSAFKREGLELTTGFTATANAEMRVGSLEETVTVTGASPVVDIQNVRQQRVLSREVLDTVPTGKTLQGFQALTLGASGPRAQQDVGGNTGDGTAGFGFQGTKSQDQKYTMDGMQFGGLGASANMRNILVNQAFVQELTVETFGASAESEAGGAHLNIVPKEGGNSFKATFAANGANEALQADNIDDELRGRGITLTSKVKKLYDWGGGMGGPIKRDSIWFYTAHRWWGAQNTIPGSYYNLNQGKYVGDPNSGVTLYEPDLSRPGIGDRWNEDHSLRVTWQATRRNKVAFSQTVQNNCNCNLGNGPSSPETFTRHRYWPISLTQATWSFPATSRLLVDAGVTGLWNNYSPLRDPAIDAEHDIAIVDLNTGRSYNNKATGLWVSDFGKRHLTNQINTRVAVSYITGSHAFKTGMTLLEGWQDYNPDLGPRPLQYQFRGAVPVSLTEWASPYLARSRFNPQMGLYGQDQWTVRRLTLNLGLRFDYLNATNPSFPIPAGPFVPAREYPERKKAPQWLDLNPRLGAAFDLFGNGKTAVKAMMGRYVLLASIWDLTYDLHPGATAAQSASRSWTDANGNYVPDCNLLASTANGECGQSSTSALGQTRDIRKYAPDVTEGFGVRPSNWQTSASVQHELRPNMALTGSWYRVSYGNIPVVDNLAITPADHDPFCITAPTDTRLGEASGARLCGLYNLNPSRFGLIDELVTQVSHYGEQREVYNGFDLALNARFGNGAILQGGVATGQTVFDDCVVVDSPQQSSVVLRYGRAVGARPDFCKSTLPFRGQTQYKFAFVEPLPLGIKLSGTYQNLAGIPIQATYLVTNAIAAPSLGRNLSEPGGTVLVDLMEPNVAFEDRLHQVDLRFTKLFRLRGARVEGQFDVYNVFNANDVLALNARYGSAWLQPGAVLGGRLFKFGAQVDF